MTSRESVFAALAKVIDPELRRPITELGMVGKITPFDDEVANSAKSAGMKVVMDRCIKVDYMNLIPEGK